MQFLGNIGNWHWQSVDEARVILSIRGVPGKFPYFLSGNFFLGGELCGSPLRARCLIDVSLLLCFSAFLPLPVSLLLYFSASLLHCFFTVLLLCCFLLICSLCLNKPQDAQYKYNPKPTRKKLKPSPKRLMQVQENPSKHTKI